MDKYEAMQSLKEGEIEAGEELEEGEREEEEKGCHNDEETEEVLRRERRKIWKNIFVMSTAFLLLFTGFQGLIRLQSSLHAVAGMGVINAGLQFLVNILACLLLPKILITKLGHKRTITLCLSCFIVWMAANGHPVWGSMIPASVLVGAAAGPLWAAQGSYFTHTARRYASITHNARRNASLTHDVTMKNDVTMKHDVTMTHDAMPATLTSFFGIIMAFYQFTGISGSLLSSSILHDVPVNVTLVDDVILATCGVHDCPHHERRNPNLAKPAPTVVWTLLGIYIALALCAPILVIIFLDECPTPKPRRDEETSTCGEVSQFLLATLKLHKQRKAILLFPLAVYSGVETGFYSAEFSKSYVSCSLGIWMVGYMTVPFGIMSTVSSFITAKIATCTGQMPFFISALVVDLVLQATLMFWMPTPDQSWVLLVLSGLWGYTDGIWQTHIPAFYGSVFHQDTEAAFASRVGGYSIGCMLAFSYSFYLCTFTKLLILTLVLLIGMIGYLIVAVPRHRDQLRQARTTRTNTLRPVTIRTNKL